MHRHGYKGRKFQRKRDQRSALIKSLAEALIQNQKIETTLPKAKELRSYVEKLITKAKKGGLDNRRRVIGSLQTVDTANMLFDEISPKISRGSGYLSISPTKLRRGDNTQLATIQFVDDLSVSKRSKSETASAPVPTAAKPAKTTKKATAKSTKPKASKSNDGDNK